MKKILFLIAVGILLSFTPSMGQKQPTQKDIIELNTKIDSLERAVDRLVYDQQRITDTQVMIVNRLIEMREDYVNLLTDSHETRNWILGMVTLIVGAFGVAFPFFSNRSAKKKSDKAEQRASLLHKSIEDIKKKSLKSEAEIKKVATQVNKDREAVRGQLDGVKSIKTQVDDIQTKIETSERNARKSQKEAMINRLFAQAANEKNNDIAIGLYTKILRFEDNDAAYIRRANLYLDNKQYDKAIIDANKVINLKSADNKNAAIAYYILAVAKANLKMYNEAVEFVNKGIEILPKNGDGYKLRASIYAQQDRSQEVIDDIYKAATVTKLNANDYNGLAYAYFKLKKFDFALSNVTESLKKNPNFPEALDTRGCIYMELGEKYYDDALDDFNQALKLNPQLWETYENRINLYDKIISKETDDSKIVELKRLRDADIETFAKRKVNLNNHNNDDDKDDDKD